MKKLLLLLIVPMVLGGAFLVGCEPIEDGDFPEEQPIQ